MDIVITCCPDCKEKVSIMRQSVTTNITWFGYCKCGLRIEYNGWNFTYIRITSGNTTTSLEQGKI